MPDLLTEITTVAGEPAQISTDGQTANSHSLPDLIEADKYLKDASAATAGTQKTGWARVRMARAIPPGAGPSG